MGTDLKIFPTVASTNVNILTDGSKLNVKVYDLNGKLLQLATYRQPEINLDVSSFESGLYLLQLEMVGRKETLKIIKR